jgi:hypothetical protein
MDIDCGNNGHNGGDDFSGADFEGDVAMETGSSTQCSAQDRDIVDKMLTDPRGVRWKKPKRHPFAYGKQKPYFQPLWRCIVWSFELLNSAVKSQQNLSLTRGRWWF